MEEDDWIQGGYGSWLMEGLSDCAIETLRDGIYREAEGKDCGKMGDALLKIYYSSLDIYSFNDDFYHNLILNCCRNVETE